jgi:hypothetical protein
MGARSNHRALARSLLFRKSADCIIVTNVELLNQAYF